MDFLKLFISVIIFNFGSFLTIDGLAELVTVFAAGLVVLVTVFVAGSYFIIAGLAELVPVVEVIFALAF